MDRVPASGASRSLYFSIPICWCLSSAACTPPHVYFSVASRLPGRARRCVYVSREPLAVSLGVSACKSMYVWIESARAALVPTRLVFPTTTPSTRGNAQDDVFPDRVHAIGGPDSTAFVQASNAIIRDCGFAVFSCVSRRDGLARCQRDRTRTSPSRSPPSH
ncbi:hypothetical protein PLICRDRAFT_699562 [Plicaturopsis crispa FD-325 SS-3]|nr:hypothetical protein PLICRDRAFT_699562 [Plicaturopsis crispa FD-325 SS-3]